MSIALMMKIEDALRRLEHLEKMNFSEGENLLIARVEKLEGELKAMKARMGKQHATADI